MRDLGHPAEPGRAPPFITSPALARATDDRVAGGVLHETDIHLGSTAAPPHRPVARAIRRCTTPSVQAYIAAPAARPPANRWPRLAQFARAAASPPHHAGFAGRDIDRCEKEENEKGKPQRMRSDFGATSKRNSNTRRVDQRKEAK